MRPKDLVMDLFGDYVRYMGGSIRLTQLTELLGVFGIEPATARVTLSRMRRDGWVETSRVGREMEYAATTQLLDVLNRGRQRIFSPHRSPWSGQWTMVLYRIPEAQRRERERLKRALAWEGFGQLNPTTWVSPHDVREKLSEELNADADSAIHVVTMSTGSLVRDQELARQCWDLEELAEGYRQFIADWSPVLHKGPGGYLDQDALRLRVQLVWEYRHFPLKDPNLPSALLPDHWPGDRAYELFVQVHQSLAKSANWYVASILEQWQPVAKMPQI